MNDVHVGITSFGATKEKIENCEKDDTHIFIRVSAYADWIKQNMALGPAHENEDKPLIFWWPY